jgi:hypothetical protein
MLYITNANCPIHFIHTVIFHAERKFEIHYTILVLLVSTCTYSTLYSSNENVLKCFS